MPARGTREKRQLGQHAVLPLPRAPRQRPEDGHTLGMGYFQIETRENEEPGNWQPGKTRLLFQCNIRLRSGEDEETLFLVGPDAGNEVMVLWKEANYGAVGAEPLSWIKLETAQEPEVYVRLLEGFLAAVHAAGTAKAADFTSIAVPPAGLLPETEIRAIFARAFAG